MKPNEVEVDVDLMKKVLSGEVEGKVEYQASINLIWYPVTRMLADDVKNDWDFVIAFENSGREFVTLADKRELRVIVTPPEPALKPFDKVIACAGVWIATFVSRYDNGYPITMDGGDWKEIYPWRDCYAKYLGTDTPWEQIVKETEGEE